ncbi:Xyloglucan 6-xylosyltransferase 2 [Quillaja saponaria]|uniref:Xyloglucan 6-xylosyltransferase 2 n=1 Tax=Quillaja saponaria TaxID=32244 RepID=A0AAD7PHH6_QUISA|nr:Xyloglucan 6-xylosyltransferase 2 [Quillaja saponaria]KAJ7955095.1 Xyloglucan 6-xylosyltransferase 2 [Quillaja saponaria]
MSIPGLALAAQEIPVDNRILIYTQGAVTFLLLLVTIIIVRSSLGAGNFGILQHDFNETRENFYSDWHTEPNHTLEVKEVLPNNTESIQSNSYTTIDISKLLLDEEEDGEKQEPDRPYSLGPKISNWDQKRAEWLKKNPGFPNFIRPNKPRVLLVTGSSPKMCENPSMRGISGVTRFTLRVLISLHGYWEIVVDGYEEMMKNYHPGLGDDRWPLVTHFVGCKPCGKFSTYPVERCLKQMDRAFNFGDNQILQLYSFTHKSLASWRVKRVRNETSSPLEMKDELGMLHLGTTTVKNPASP